MDGTENSALRRSSRRAARTRFRIPNVEHYVGYVEDDETPEMIMQKFEEFERVIPSSSNHHSNGDSQAAQKLTEDELARVFEATSGFSVKEAYEDVHPLLNDNLHSEDDLASESDEDFMLSEDELEDDDLIEKSSIAKHKCRSRKERTQVLEKYDYDESVGFRRKPKSVKNVAEFIHIRLPHPPLPPAWGRTVKPFGKPLSQTKGDSTDPVLLDFKNLDEKLAPVIHELPDLISADLSTFYKKFVGVMINPGWTVKQKSDNLTNLLVQLPIPKVCPEGFVFIWIPKTYLQLVWKVMTSWKFTYVESLSWVHLKPNNKIRQDLEDENWIIPRSHVTLYIFRKGGKDIEIKHQRSSDLVFDVYVPNEEFQVPHEVYNVIETMLPNSLGKLIELWSGRNSHRPGWIHVIES